MTPPNKRNGQRFADDDAENRVVCEAERLQYAHFFDALTNGHRHRVARDQQDRERDGGADDQQKELDVAEERDEAQSELLLGFRFGLRRGVLKHRIHRLRDPRHFVGLSASTATVLI